MYKQEIPDNELIVTYLNGNEEALGTLIERHKQKIFTSILLVIKDRSLAEDIFQDTFIKVIKTLKSGNYKEEGKFLPWVLRIAQNLVIDHFRKMKRMPMVRDTEEYSVISTLRITDNNIEDRIIHEQILSDVRDLIQELPENQREVVMMRHYAGMSFKDIAEATGVSINTSLGRMRYALINLRKLIEEKKLILTK